MTRKREEGGKEAAGGKTRQGREADPSRYLSRHLNARGIPAQARPSHLPKMRKPMTRRHATRRTHARRLQKDLHSRLHQPQVR